MGHGVSISEIPTSIVPPARTTAGLPVFVGTAPIHLAQDEDAAANVNGPKLCYSYKEAVELFGFSRDFKRWTLCEAIYTYFALYNVAPIVLVNVFDPDVHKAREENVTVALVDGIGNLKKDVRKEALIVQAGDATAEIGKDYELSYDGEENLLLTATKTGLLADAESVVVTLDRVDPFLVDKYDVIGGVDVESGEYEGLELINSVFPLFGLVPGLVVVPKWSTDPAVAAVMRAKAENINGHFRCSCLCDIPSDAEKGAKKYQEVSAWKNSNNYVSERLYCCWPLVGLGDDVYWMSTHLAALINQVDAKNEEIPYESPSNKNFQMNRLLRADGTEVVLGPEMANYLNGEGIVTGLNFIGGWKAWGNRTSAYPSITDPKDAFIVHRRMFDWLGNQFILTMWQQVDKPMTRRLVRTVVNSWNYYLNGLAAREFILGGRIEFLEDENPLTDLIDGKMKFHMSIGTPSPAEHVAGIVEFDPSYFANLFAA